MGSKPIPAYANLLIATINKLIMNKDKEQSILLLNRFLDDFFLVFRGSTKELLALFCQNKPNTSNN